MTYPKPTKKKSKAKAVADSYLDELWRKAVRAYWSKQIETPRIYGAMVSAGAESGGSIECHHIIHRKHFATRWDYRNGFPVSTGLHKWIHANPNKATAIFIQLHPCADYLLAKENILKPDLLLALNMTEGEYRKHIKDELRELIKKYEEEL